MTCHKEVKNASIKGIDICFFGADRFSNIGETVIENTVSFPLFKDLTTFNLKVARKFKLQETNTNVGSLDLDPGF